MPMIGNIATIRSVQRYHYGKKGMMAHSCGRGLKAGAAPLLREENLRSRRREEIQRAVEDRLDRLERLDGQGKCVPTRSKETAGVLMVHALRGPFGFFGVSKEKRFVVLDPEKGTLSYFKGPSAHGSSRRSFSLHKLTAFDHNPSGKLLFLHFEKDPDLNLSGGFLKVGAETEAEFASWMRALSQYKDLEPC